MPPQPRHGARAVVYLSALASLAVVRVARRYELHLRQAVAALGSVAQARARARCVAVSGTLRTLKPKAILEYDVRMVALSGLSNKVRPACALMSYQSVLVTIIASQGSRPCLGAACAMCTCSIAHGSRVTCDTTHM
jgi:Rpp14/Pop5 family